MNRVKRIYQSWKYSWLGSWVGILDSPFRLPKLKFYWGEIQVGVPYFLPRKWKKGKDGINFPHYITKFGIDSCELGWKTKWTNTDYRFEWSPLISLVIFGKQLAIWVKAPVHEDSYWTAWLYYKNHTKGTKVQRIQQCINDFGCTWISYKKDNEPERVDHYLTILRPKYLKYVTQGSE